MTKNPYRPLVVTSGVGRRTVRGAASLELLDLEAGRQGLLQLLRFLLVGDLERVQESGATHL